MGEAMTLSSSTLRMSCQAMPPLRASAEIEFLDGFVVREGENVGLSCTANAVLMDIVKRVERNELSPDPRHITELRLN
jgi:ketopantoate reductase